MYEFYYIVLQPKFGEDNIEILYTDTDSFILKLKTLNLTKALKKLKHYFDFSNYPKDHVLYDTSNTKVPGKFKDELGGEEMIEFVALRSKMYSYRTRTSEEKKLKGISKNVIKKEICFDDYLIALYDGKVYNHNMRTLGSDKHNMYLKETNKTSLSPYDDKRWIDKDKIHTLPHGSNELEGN